MLGLLRKLAPLITGMTKDESGVPLKVSGDFQWLVRLPLALGAILVLVGLFAPVGADKQEELYEIGIALLVGGPVAYSARRQLKKGDVVAPAKPPVAAEPPPEAAQPPAQAEPPKTDADAAKQIENL